MSGSDKNSKCSTLSPGKELAQKRKIVDSLCEICGEPFKGLKSRKTCSDKCRKAKSRL